MGRHSYGERLDEHWHGKTIVTSLALRGATGSDVTIARIAGGPDFGFVEPVPAQEGYAFSLELSDYEKGELWLDGRSTPQTGLLRNNCVFFDLRSRVEAKLEDPFDTLHFHVPRRYFDSLARAGGRPPMGDLRVVSGQGFFDPVISHLGLAMTAALERSGELSQLFLDQTMVALCTHIAGAYGTALEPRAVAKGLAAWQVKRAREMIADRLDGNLTIAEIAAACGLTPSYFARQFARVTGMTPHRWLLKMRVDRGRQLLLEGRMTIAEIAVACGFADQSHFTRVFSREIGTSPKAWRDAHRQ
ncbi:helix-turn-helix domain-containing protein [Segnochrobactrum spirostomi]|nr:AraC family transcriptional regulator [Segnochrobactrum spirostomi]